MSAPRYYLKGNFKKFRQIFINSGFEKRTFQAGDILIQPHNTWTHIYYLLSGEAKVSIVESNLGKDLAYCGSDYLVPFALSTDSPIQNLMQVEAVTEIEAIVVPREQWHRLSEYPELNEEIRQMLMDYIYLLAHELESQTFDSGMEKVASFLYTVYENTDNEQINIPMNSLCSFIGLNRTNLNKYLNVLIEDGVVRKVKRSVLILHPEKLKTYCSERVLKCKIIPPGKTEIQPAKYDFKQKIVHEMYDFFSIHFCEQDEIEKFISELPMDYGYLNRLFKMQYDRTMRAYILEQRLDYAAELLIKTDKKVVDVAYESGFNSVSGFYRSFKENLGISPTEYRKENR